MHLPVHSETKHSCLPFLTNSWKFIYFFECPFMRNNLNGYFLTNQYFSQWFFVFLISQSIFCATDQNSFWFWFSNILCIFPLVSEVPQQVVKALGMSTTAPTLTRSGQMTSAATQVPPGVPSRTKDPNEKLTMAELWSMYLSGTCVGVINAAVFHPVDVLRIRCVI